MFKKIFGTILYIFVTLFAYYCYADLQALFWKSGNEFPIVFGSFTYTTTPMSMLWLLAAIVFVIFLPKLWRKVHILKLPARIVFFLSVGYIVGMIMEAIGIAPII